jgi:hypothetical protein
MLHDPNTLDFACMQVILVTASITPPKYLLGACCMLRSQSQRKRQEITTRPLSVLRSEPRLCMGGLVGTGGLEFALRA